MLLTFLQTDIVIGISIYMLPVINSQLKLFFDFYNRATFEKTKKAKIMNV